MSDYDDDGSGSLGLARKYRPTSLADYVGSEKLKKTIYNRLKKAQLAGVSFPQQIILMGYTGCGKTTLARIIMKEYQCSNRDPDTGACDECDECVSIDQYIRTGDDSSVLDIHEIDAAEKSSKGELSALSEEMEQLEGWNYSMWLLDEYQRATKAAQASQLKTFEEPPANAVIMIATTNPEDILDTILNRMRLRLKIVKPTVNELVAHLENICNTEGISYDREGLRMIATISNRIIRDSLNLLEDVAESRGTARAREVADHFDQVQDEVLMEFMRAYRDRDYVKYAYLLYKIQNRQSLDQFVGSFTAFVTRGIYIANGTELEGLTVGEIESYRKVFCEFTPRELSVILANLRKLDRGDIEANLMAFIYDEGDFSLPTEAAQGTVSVEEASLNSIAKDNRAKSKAIEAKESAAMTRAVESISASVSSFSKEGTLDFLKAKKVS